VERPWTASRETALAQGQEEQGLAKMLTVRKFERCPRLPRVTPAKVPWSYRRAEILANCLAPSLRRRQRHRGEVWRATGRVRPPEE